MLRMFRRPEEVERRRDIMRDVPLDCSSTEDSGEFLTANPTPYNLGSSGSFPCEMNV